MPFVQSKASVSSSETVPVSGAVIEVLSDSSRTFKKAVDRQPAPLSRSEMNVEALIGWIVNEQGGATSGRLSNLRLEAGMDFSQDVLRVIQSDLDLDAALPSLALDHAAANGNGAESQFAKQAGRRSNAVVLKLCTDAISKRIAETKDAVRSLLVKDPGARDALLEDVGNPLRETALRYLQALEKGDADPEDDQLIDFERELVEARAAKAEAERLRREALLEAERAAKRAREEAERREREERERAEREARERKLRMATDEVEALLQEFNRYIDEGIFLEASAVCDQITSKAETIELTLTLEDTDFSRTAMAAEVKGILRARLDHLLSSAIKIDANHDIITISIRRRVKVPGESRASVTSVEVMDALETASLLEDVVAPVIRTLQKSVVKPLVVDQKWSIETVEELESFLLTARARESGPEDTLFAVFPKLDAIFRFLSYLAPPQSSTHPRPFYSFVGKLLWPDLARTLIDSQLSPRIPEDGASLPEFTATANAACGTFERSLLSLGVIDDKGRHLTAFCAGVDAHFSQRKKERLLGSVAALARGEDFGVRRVVRSQDGAVDLLASVEAVVGGEVGGIEGPSKRGALYVAGDKAFQLLDGLLAFPTCSVSVRAAKLVEILTAALAEAAELNPYCTRDALDLYFHLYPFRHGARLDSLPQLSAIAHNDFMYLAHELARLGLVWRNKLAKDVEEGALPSVPTKVRPLEWLDVTYIDFVPRFRKVGVDILNRQMSLQRDEVLRIVEDTNGLSMMELGRKEAVERSMKQLMHLLSHLNQMWKPILPSNLCMRLMGHLVSEAFDAIIVEVEALPDITDEESHSLNACLGRLLHADAFFKAEEGGGAPATMKNWAQDYVSNWRKFEEITSVLVLSFADIMGRLRDGRYADFKGEELAKLCRALFADTPLRQKNLEEIKRSLPK
ncbi:Centromere/kinetochore protein zw10 [Irineochytrium annulatum]|nr:Centromere/kinetochore protein zw10 [Irineochytrium annulatum]